MITVRGHLIDIAVPGFARIYAKLLGRLAAQQVPGAFDVPSRERLAVVPSHAVAQREGQFGSFLVRGPAGGQIRDDRPHAVLWYVLPVHYEVIENPHHRPQCRGRRFFEERHARRAVEMGDFENTTGFLGEGRVSSSQRKRQHTRCREHAQISLHFQPPVRGHGPRPATASLLARLLGSRARNSVGRLPQFERGDHDPKPAKPEPNRIVLQGGE